jgi:ferredoxin-thioredoxin reductase catalytic subunit
MNQWTTHDAEYDALRKDLEEVATRAGYVLNPDGGRLEKVLGLMTENLVLTGKRFCPCKQSHPLDPGRDVVCPCPEWKREIETEGHCFCRLFFVREKP